MKDTYPVNVTSQGLYAKFLKDQGWQVRKEGPEYKATNRVRKNPQGTKFGRAA